MGLAVRSRRTVMHAAGVVAVLALVGSGVAVAARAARRADRFSHERHAGLFPSCAGCHAGAQADSGAIWPAPTTCEACHDGTVKPRTDWRPPAALPRTNLRFDHATHRRRVADSIASCVTCHTEPGSPRMQVRLASVPRCLACHGITAGHFEAPDTACATCHLPLAAAARLAPADIAGFPVPASHRDSTFRAGGHGRIAAAPHTGVSAACATCHARDFCAACHVNAPEVPVIQALRPDPRSLAIAAVLRPPPSHARPEFLRRHGALTGRESCASCHTRESCTVCHREAPPRAVRLLASAAEGRGHGAQTARRRPTGHGADFSESHAGAARAAPRTCANCHARAECLSCHRPDAGSGSGAGGYHPAGFLTSHPAAAYSRVTSCANCHNQSAFCSACHEKAGLVSRGVLRPGFHDARPAFLLGHGQAARQSLESCTSCHVERDCLTCHSALGGRRFNPHGPGFDADRLRRRNPGMCIACHGQAIPGAGS